MAVNITLPVPGDSASQGIWGTTLNNAITAINNALGTSMQLTGATNQARFVGGTVSGAPTVGTFQTRDFVIDGTGSIYICTAGGTPGTWAQVQAGGGTLSITDNGDGTSTVSLGGGSGSITDNGDGTVTITA